MIQKLTKLSEKTKAVIIPNTLLKQLDYPEEFELKLEDGKITLTSVAKKETKNKDFHIDNSIDLYQID